MSIRQVELLTLGLALVLPARAAESIAADWAFHPVTPVTLPAPPRASSGSTNPIDRFIEARLAREKLAPTPPADARTLVRRLSLDLIGLPPSPTEVEAFIQSAARDLPTAVGALADQLLASPHHGERWARHWLDVVRFGESQGFEYDKIRDNAWRYRDYVINAFNADKPYDQFIREQIAGDVLDPVTPEGIVATGFLVAGPWDQAGAGSVSPSVKAATRESELEDMIGTLGQTFLGVTLNCARCHDHKFDPIPQRDYYRVKAVLQGVRHGERSLVTPEERVALDRARSERQRRVTELNQRLAELDAAARQRVTQTVRGSINAILTGSNPPPLARWSFATDARDEFGALGGTLHGGARVESGRLLLDGKEACVITEPLRTPLGEKTLEAWVNLSSLDQGGGGVISVETTGGDRFDSLVFGERLAKRWMAGSESYRRSRDFPEAPEETAKPGELVHVAGVFGSDGTIALFRNGRPYGPAYRPAEGPANFAAGEARVLLGRRHTGGGRAHLSGEIAEARLYDRALTSNEIAASFAAGPDASPVRAEDLLAALTAPERRDRSELLEERERLLATGRKAAPAPLTYAANPDKPGATFVLHRGEPDKPREQVTPGALSAVAQPGADLGLAQDAPESERRRRFADWVANPANPLTARVLVNRVWQHHFGHGLVATPNDFGKMGARPSHPELLDWLAGWFVSPDGAHWSLRKLHRLLTTSETYRRASRSESSADAQGPRDPDNTLFGRFASRRIEAEAVRDAMLALSGELNPAVGGPGFRPFELRGGGNQNEYFAADPIGPDFNRRTIYRLGVHSARDPLLDSLDCPEFSTRTPVRAHTTTPLQALSLMNNSFVQRQAAKLAARVEGEAGGTIEVQVRSLWARAYSRDPREDELRAATRLAQEHGLATVVWTVLNSSEFVFVR